MNKVLQVGLVTQDLKVFKVLQVGQVGLVLLVTQDQQVQLDGLVHKVFKV